VKIAQVAPLYERVPPKYYGGTERVVSYLSEELVRQGHEVTLFARGDSVTKARLIAPCRRSLRHNKHRLDKLSHHMVELELVFKDPPVSTSSTSDARNVDALEHRSHPGVSLPLLLAIFHGLTLLVSIQSPGVFGVLVYLSFWLYFVVLPLWSQSDHREPWS
jgi:glycosyltransferase involved in cell wall biosynthesis